MYLFYMDESGDPNGWQVQTHFVLGGVAVHEGQVYGLTKQLDNLQAEFFPGIAVPIVFHATDVRTGKGHFRSLLPADRDRLLDCLYGVIGRSRFPNLITFATAMHINAVHSADQVLHDTFEDVCQRFNTLLVRQFNLGHPDKGMLIIDEAHAERYRSLIADFRQSGTRHGYLGNIVDIPYFAKRHHTRMLQLADFCANAVFRYYESGDAKYFGQILPRFDRRAPSHPPDGLKHITGVGYDCSCDACRWR